MELTLENWLSNAGRANDVLQCMYEIIRCGKGKYSRFFQNCGLYAVGSSLTQKNPNDIDLVLVGLDFRAIAKYNKVFLQDPETLIKKEIVIPPNLARKLGIVNPLCFHINENGMQSIWHSLPERPEIIDNKGLEAELITPDRLEDLDDIHRFMLEGIEYKGQYWAFNFQKSMAGSTALSLDNYCLIQASASRLVTDFAQRISKKFFQNYHYWNLSTPFEPYFHEEEYFLTINFPLHEIGCPPQIGGDRKQCNCRPIHIILHAENLHVKYWKEHQKALNMPYLCLHEWPKANEITERRILTKMPYPEFIDPNGEERVKPHYYFLYLNQAPINA